MKQNMSKNTTIEQIISLVFLIRKIMYSNLSQEKNKEVSFLQLVSLHYIKEKSPLMKELADFLGVTPSSATSFVDTLKRKKLVERKLGEKDRRIIRLTISSQGEKYIKKGRNKSIQRIKKILTKLSKKEQNDLVKILNKITSN